MSKIAVFAPSQEAFEAWAQGMPDALMVPTAGDPPEWLIFVENQFVSLVFLPGYASHYSLARIAVVKSLLIVPRSEVLRDNASGRFEDAEVGIEPAVQDNSLEAAVERNRILLAERLNLRDRARRTQSPELEEARAEVERVRLNGDIRARALEVERRRAQQPDSGAALAQRAQSLETFMRQTLRARGPRRP